MDDSAGTLRRKANPHVVPLSTEAFEVIEHLRQTADSDASVLRWRAKAKRPHLTSMGRSLFRIREKTLIPGWTVHDFRTPIRTHAVRAIEDGGLAIPGHVADAALGHKEPMLGFERCAGDGDRYLLHEKQDALHKCSAFIMEAARLRFCANGNG